MAYLIVLIGIPGSGKSSYAQTIAKVYSQESEENYVVCSSDAVRARLYGDESIQGNPNTVFTHLHNEVRENLENGVNVLYDATNVSRKSRKNIIKLGKSIPNTKIEAHVVWAPIETCIKRDAERDRHVGKEVIDKMLRRWETPWYDEGFDSLRFIPTWDMSFSHKEYADKHWADMNILHDNPHHSLGVQEHCKEASKRAYWYAYSPIIRAAAHWHDVGKPHTKFYKKDSEGNVIPHAHYYNHDNVGGYISLGIRDYYNLRDLILDDNTVLQFSWLISNHMQPFYNSNYYKNMDPKLKELIDQLHKCDVEAH